MAALDAGGECHGLAFRIEASLVNQETEILWMREMIGYGYAPVFRTALTPQGPVEALAFVIGKSSPYFADVSGAEAAAIIATGKGPLGTNREYFDNLAEHVRLLGIEDQVFEDIRSELRLQAAQSNAGERAPASDMPPENRRRLQKARVIAIIRSHGAFRAAFW